MERQHFQHRPVARKIVPVQKSIRCRVEDNVQVYSDRTKRDLVCKYIPRKIALLHDKLLTSLEAFQLGAVIDQFCLHPTKRLCAHPSLTYGFPNELSRVNKKSTYVLLAH